MRTVTGLFDSHDQARAAVAALEEAGIVSDDISLISAGTDVEENTSAGIGIGSAVGGVGGLLAGLGAFAIPGIGPVIGAGWLATALIGAAIGGVAGGLIGTFTESGVDRDEAHVYAEGVRRGGSVVVARVDESQTDAAATILGQSGSVDVNERRRSFEETGWTGYDETAGVWKREDQDPSDGPIIPPLPR
jgi:hypothetical protein